MGKADLSVDDIVTKCTQAGRNISRGQIYKWVNSDQTKINSAQLDALCAALSDNVSDHARLLAAHLEDERFGSARDMVSVHILPDDCLNDQPKQTTKGEKAIQFLSGQRITSKSVDDLVIDLAQCLGADLSSSGKP